MFSVHLSRDAHEEQVTVITLEVATLDEAAVSKLDERLTEEIDGRLHETIHLDMKNVDYISSTAIGKIMAIYRRLKNGGGKLVLVNVNEFPADVFRITGLSKALDVHPCPTPSAK